MGIAVNETATARIRAISGRLRNMGEFLSSEASRMESVVAQAFSTASSPVDGSRFRPNAPRTIRLKKSSKPLTDTGAMAASFQAEPAGNSLIASFGVPYAGFNVFGTTKTPQRNPLPLVASGVNSFSVPDGSAYWTGFRERLKAWLIERNGRR